MGRSYTTEYYERPETPWCLIGKVSYGVAVVCKVPESKAAYYCAEHEFIVLIRDSEFPVPIDDAGTMPDICAPQSNPRRVYRGHDYTEGDGA